MSKAAIGSKVQNPETKIHSQKSKNPNVKGAALLFFTFAHSYLR